MQRPYRGGGIGKKLLAAYESMLRSEGLHQYYAEAMSSSTWKPESHYSRLGYEIYNRKRTTVFEPELETPLYVLCVLRRL